MRLLFGRPQPLGRKVMVMLTLQELREIIDIPKKGVRLPTVKYLRDCGKEIACERLGINVWIIAYQNGYAVYRVGNRSTVISIHSCGDYLYASLGKITCISETYFWKKIWYLRLVLEGEDRLAHNRDISEAEKKVSYNAISEEWLALMDTDNSPLEDIIQNETVDELLGLLTERQHFVVCQFFFCQKTLQEISNELGITFQSVSRTLSQAIQKMRKSCGKVPADMRGGISYAW